MKVLVSWLRELVDVKAGAEDLGQRLHLAGFELAGIEPHGADSIVDLEITANRPDCLSMVGIAREVVDALRHAAALAGFVVSRGR